MDDDGGEQVEPGHAVVLAPAAVREGDTLVVPKLDRLARSVPDARAIADRLRERGVKLALGRTLYDPGDPMGKLLFNILATFAYSEAELIRMRTRKGMAIARARGNCAASSPNSPTDSSGNSAACMPRASIPSAISPSSSPSQDQTSTTNSTGAISLSVRSSPYRNRPEPVHQREPAVAAPADSGPWQAFVARQPPCSLNRWPNHQSGSM